MSESYPYLSHVHIERSDGPVRWATLPTGETVTFGVHTDIAAHYGISMDDDEGHAATLDYLVAATAAAMVGTFARTLRDEGMVLASGDLHADAVGRFVSDQGELVLSDIEVAYTLGIPADPVAVDRAHDRHASMCPLVKTLGRCVEIHSSVRLTGGGTSA